MAWFKIVIFGLILAYPVKTAWNYVMTDFGFAEITFGKALCLWMLVNMLLFSTWINKEDAK